MKADHAQQYKTLVSDPGRKEKHFHFIRDLQWQYNHELADLTRSQRLPNFVEYLYNHVSAKRRANLPRYKEGVYRVDKADSFQVIHDFDS